MRYINLRLCLSLLLLSVPGLAAAETIELVRKHGVFMVPVRINDAVTTPFVLDSGAGDVSVPEDVFKTLLRTGTVTESDFRQPGVYVTADGSEHMERRFILHEVRVGDRVVKDVVASVAPDKAAPLLGQSFLARLPGWSIDNVRHALVLGGAAPSTAATGAPTGGPPLQIPVAPLFGIGGFGAFAYDISSGKFGHSWNQPDQPNADVAAIKGCDTASCKIVFRIGPHECGALAMSGDGKVWGGAKRDTIDVATLAALQNCQRRTANQCVVRSAQCNR